MTSLDQLAVGQRACITGVAGADALGQRLLEMGLTEGEDVEVLGFAPFGDPLEVRLRDYRLSLRKREAARVAVELYAVGAVRRVAAIPAPAADEPSSQEAARESAAGAAPSRGKTVALVGNPNTGKTTLFNALTGLRQHVGNYPGVTVETKEGRLTWHGHAFDMIDLPGTYSLAPRSPDEMVTVDLVLGQQPGAPRPDVLVSIVDASNLERNLYLTTQLLELGLPVVIALNMVDLAEGQGMKLDAVRLGRQLGVPVVPIQANKRKGLDGLKAAILEEVSGTRSAERGAPGAPRSALRAPLGFPDAFRAEEEELGRALDGVPPFLLRRLLLDVGGGVEERLVEQHGDELRQRVADARQRLEAAGCPVPAIEAKVRYGWVRDRVAGCLHRPDERPFSWTDRLDRILTHRAWGTLLFLALMFVVFQAIFAWATPLMDLVKAGKDVVGEALRGVLPAGPVGSLLVDGVFEGVGAVLIFLPQILILFGFIAVLEDCGYMARVAFLMDRLMARCGLSGKSFLPMLSSVACAVPGIMATRVISDRRDRLATILVAPLMSCSARLPVYTLLIAAFLTTGFPWWVPGLTLFAMYCLGLVLAPLVALFLKRTLLRGETPPFVLEMPTYKWPSARQVVRRMTDSGWEFVRRAGTLILAAMILVWALLYFPRGDGQGGTYDERTDSLRKEIKALHEEAEESDLLGALVCDTRAEEAEEELKELSGEWKRQSILGRMGRAIEPAVKPLGWDWKIGMAALASFPAREVVVGTLGVIYNLGEGSTEELKQPLAERLPQETWDGEPGRKVFTVPVALSLMVFFALCCQCTSTLAVIRRETRSWGWPVFTFVYMTALAYVGALAVYQVGSWLGG